MITLKEIHMVIQCKFCEDGIYADILEAYRNILYVVKCNQCGKVYEILQRDYHPRPIEKEKANLSMAR